MDEKNWFQDADRSDELLDTEEEIFQYILDEVATHPQEIANKLGLSLRTVQHHLRRMFNANHIGILHTPFYGCPGRIAYRITSLRAEGMTGNDIRKRTWYCVMESGKELEERLCDEHSFRFRMPFCKRQEQG